MHVYKPEMYGLTTGSNLTSNGTGPVDDTMENLYPAIVQSFSIILLGYLAGRFGLITSSQSEGLGYYVSRFALPALLFRSMAILDLTEINWPLLAGVAFAKLVVFMLVMLATLLLGRPVNLGTAGLFAIFTTQSNDFALGYPIVSAVFGKTNPSYVSFLYLVAPVSLVVLNPVGFTLLEVQKWRSISRERRPSFWHAVLSVIRGVFLNPIVFMSVLGVAGNFIFSRHIPKVLDQLLKMLGDSFSGTALFFLGQNLVGKVQKQNKGAIITVMFLVCAKMLIFPCLAKECTTWLLHVTSHPENVTTEMSNYAFLYGTIPSAPSVFLYSAQYNTAKGIVATGLVIGTFLSAPVMFVSARMVTLHITEETDFRDLITTTSFDVSILTLITTVWVLVIFVLARRVRSIPHRFTVGLLISQMLYAVGVILWVSVDFSLHPGVKYLQYTLYTLGLAGTFSCTSAIVVCLCALRMRSLCFILRHIHWLYAMAIGVPLIITPGLVVDSMDKQSEGIDPAMAFGDTQLLARTCLLSATILIIVTTLIVRHRHDITSIVTRSRQVTMETPGDDPMIPNHIDPIQSVNSETTEGASDSEIITQNNVQHPERIRPRRGRVIKRRRGESMSQEEGEATRQSWSHTACNTCSSTGCVANPGAPAARSTNIEDMIPFPSSVQRYPDPERFDFTPVNNHDNRADESTPLISDSERLVIAGQNSLPDSDRCNLSERVKCQELLKRYESVQLGSMKDEEAVIAQSRDLHQETRHVLLVLLILLTAVVDLFLCVCKLMGGMADGIFIEIEFLHCVLTYGQGIYAFGLFGLDMKLIVAPLLKRFRKLFNRSDEVILPAPHDLDDVTVHMCESFITYHRDRCKQELVGCKRYRLRKYRNVLVGCEFVDWLIEVGLAKDRSDAVNLGNKLVQGRVIEHAQKEHYFHDLPYLYKFNEDEVLE